MSSYENDVLGWSDHLRRGGTMPWVEFLGSSEARRVAATGEPLPGAAQLELVRLLGCRWKGPGFAALADRVVSRDGPGRGLAHALPLAHPLTPRRSGAPPIDPATVPRQELIRVGVGLLTDLTLAADRPEPATTRAKRRTWRKPRTAAVSAPTLDELLTEVWATKTLAGAAMPWRRFVRNWAARGALPFLANPAQLAARAASRVGAAQVHVYVGAAARSDVAPGLPVESLDLLRRINPVLGLRVPEEELAAARLAAVRLLDGPSTGPGTGPLAVPKAHRQWARRQTDDIVRALRDGGYSVHGDLEEFAAGVKAPQHPRAQAVLDRLLDVVVHSVGEHSVGEHSVGEHSVGEQSVGEQSVGEHSVGEQLVREEQR